MPQGNFPTTGTDRLGRYYTRLDISNFLISQLVGGSATRVLDLGSGAGSLSLAAAKSWQPAELVTVDIDRHAIRTINKTLSEANSLALHTHITADVLSTRFPTLLVDKVGTLDVGICNPPFLTPQWRKGYGEILEAGGFSGCLPSLQTVDAALLFLAQNMRLLSDGAPLGIILPDTLISSMKYRSFRRELLSRYTVHRIIRLPRCSFLKTDALAHIAIISKKKSSSNSVQLLELSNEGLSSPIDVEFDAAIYRMDFAYHITEEKKISDKNILALSQLGCDIKRGSISSSIARQMETHTLHTHDITSDRAGKWCDLRHYGSMISHRNSGRDSLITASPGDILVARIGRNLEWKVMGVSRGFPIITDCVMRLRVPKLHRTSVLTQLTSDFGRNWLRSKAYGVGAKQISKTDLLSFPIEI